MKIKQLAAELYGCNETINDLDKLLEGGIAAAKEVGAIVLGTSHAQYTPHGITAVVFLAESHILLTTWPELDLLMVDALLCNPDMPVDKVLAVLKARFCPDGEVREQSLVRVVSKTPRKLEPA